MKLAKHFFSIISFLVMIIFLFFTACKPPESTEDVYVSIACSNIYTEDQPQAVYHIDTSGNVILTYALDLGTNSKDVYFIFTNTSTSNSKSYPSITALSPTPSPPSLQTQNVQSNTVDFSITSQPLIIKDMPSATKFNHEISPLLIAKKFNTNKNINRSLGPVPTSPQFNTFNALELPPPYNVEYPIQVSATSRYTLLDSSTGRTLTIWVADDCWTSLINQTMVNTMGSKFLSTGANNDIYDWVSQIFGAEWGDYTDDYNGILINKTLKDINILLYNIDGNTNPGGCIGYFYAGDNFLNTYISDSNEKLILYMDAGTFAKADGAWEITDDNPSLTISTLAHEFQHMIHFYQKAVVCEGENSDTWLNEMCSLTSEDLTAYYSHTNWPRGVAYDDGTAGSAGNINGRLPDYQYNDYSLSSWDNNNESYALAYGFGAYLARNFGGAQLFRNIVQNPFGSGQAITWALGQAGYPNETFTSVLCKWGAANLLSGYTSLPTGYENYYYNKGGFMNVTIDTYNYYLGSINLNNYITAWTGYKYYTSVTWPTFGNQPATSNLYYQAGSAITGSQQWEIKMERNTYLTVVIK